MAMKKTRDTASNCSHCPQSGVDAWITMYKIVWYNSVINSKISLHTLRAHFIASMFWNPSYPLAMLLFRRSNLETDSLRMASWLRRSFPLQPSPNVAACFSLLQYISWSVAIQQPSHVVQNLWVKFSWLKFLQIAKISTVWDKSLQLWKLCPTIIFCCKL